MLKHELIHFLLTLGLSIILFIFFHDLRLMPIAFLFGFFVDVDHLFDYLKWKKRNFSLKEFFTPSVYARGSKKTYVPFHGWEFLPLIYFLGNLLRIKLSIEGLQWAATLAYFGHMFWDQIYVSPKPLAYFFIYRLINNFDLKEFDRKQ